MTSPVTIISTRQFSRRPAAVLLSATGSALPMPAAVTLLTDDDLDAIAGKRDQLAGKIQERYGITKEEAQKQIDDWIPDTSRVSVTESSHERKAS